MNTDNSPGHETPRSFDQERFEAAQNLWDACRDIHDRFTPENIEGTIETGDKLRIYAGQQWEVITPQGIYGIERRHYTDTDEYTWWISGNTLPESLTREGFEPPFAIELGDNEQLQARCFRKGSDNPGMAPLELVTEVTKHIEDRLGQE